ncbi:unnamed protein product [Cladocopium goreaui]|uniref:Uncharacterized protein n=1 Tax=Cladocopium goreaui TaxID=2562237 RepID=A0A9P1GD44_9DINO|nr:unnamed protein product [Cladocopium goreaui]
MSMPAGDMPTLPKIATPQSAYDKAEEEGDAERVPSMRSVRSGASSRSSLTGLTTASLRKEVSVSLPGSSLDFHSRLSHGSATRFCTRGSGCRGGQNRGAAKRKASDRADCEAAT